MIRSLFKKIFFKKDDKYKERLEEFYRLLEKGINSFKTKNFQKAEVYFLMAIKLDGNRFEGHFNLAILYYDWDYVDKAMESFEKALAIKPEHDECYLYLGKCYKKKKQAERAYRYIKKAASLGNKEAQEIL